LFRVVSYFPRCIYKTIFNIGTIAVWCLQESLVSFESRPFNPIMTTRNRRSQNMSTRTSTHKTGVSPAQLQKVAQQALGYDELRPGQHEALNALLSGHDTLVVMPTGGGKSAIYQVAARLLPGPTVVVSPLLALQRDQMDAINSDDADVGDAAAVSSAQSTSQRRQALDDLENGDIEFLFLAPEQFSNADVLQKLRSASPSLLVIDEAHCISEWGHDFRPDYGRLGQVVEELGRPRVLALTATAAPPVRREIVEKLGLQNPQMVIHGFDRPNIFLEVRPFLDDEARRMALCEEVVRALENSEQPGIVYAATRSAAEELCALLNERGVDALCYHAGLRKAERDETQTRFMNGEAPVIVATNAFGMGVDKADVRWVFHHHASDSLDSYYQEIGRAGRDGQEARAVLFYDARDFGLHRFFAGGGRLEEEQLCAALQEILFHRQTTLDELQEKTEFSRAKLMRVLASLQEMEIVRFAATGEIERLQEISDLQSLIETLQQKAEQQRIFEQSRLQMMQEFAEGRSCRRVFVLNYFGEEYSAQSCNNCDNCRNASGELLLTETVEKIPFPIGSSVTHEQWGDGQVLRYEADKITVLFDSVGYKTLVVDLVLANNILQNAIPAAA
jgi:ATP-dependent DNA helicase RecQ